MSDDPKCGFCGFPVVNMREPGVRYMSDSVCHPEPECFRLLKDRIDDLRSRNEELEEALDKTTQVVEEYLEPCLGVVRENRREALASPPDSEEAGIDYPYPGEFDAETAMPDSEPAEGDALEAAELLHQRLLDGRDVPMPKNKEHAEALATIGLRWLEDNGYREPAEGAGEMRLPRLTDAEKEAFGDTGLLEFDPDTGWQWSQAAVDFACAIKSGGYMTREELESRGTAQRQDAMLERREVAPPWEAITRYIDLEVANYTFEADEGVHEPTDFERLLIMDFAHGIVPGVLRRALSRTSDEGGVPEAVNVVFDGPPGPNPPHFVEVETDDGRSVRVGEWIKRDDGMWALRIDRAIAQAEQGRAPHRKISDSVLKHIDRINDPINEQQWYDCVCAMLREINEVLAAAPQPEHSQPDSGDDVT